jgi:hypothetical protein
MRSIWIGTFIAAASIYPMNASPLDPGKNEYVKSCQPCHGKTGEGDGPRGKTLITNPTDLTRLLEANKGVFPFVHVYEVIDGSLDVVMHGPRDMPVWGNAYNTGVMCNPDYRGIRLITCSMRWHVAGFWNSFSTFRPYTGSKLNSGIAAHRLASRRLRTPARDGAALDLQDRRADSEGLVLREREKRTADSYRSFHMYGLFPTALLNRESEEFQSVLSRENRASSRFPCTAYSILWRALLVSLFAIVAAIRAAPFASAGAT